MEGFLQSLDSPCLHAPQRSCFKQGENTVETKAGRRNPYSLSDALTTFFSYNLLAQKRQLSLPAPIPTFPEQRSLIRLLPKERQRTIESLRPRRNNSVRFGYSGPAGTTASDSVIPAPPEQ